METAIITLTPTPPYDFDLTAAAATHFSGHYGAEAFQDGVFQRLLSFSEHLCLASVRTMGKVDTPQLELELTATFLNQAIVTEACRQVSWILGIRPYNKQLVKSPSSLDCQ